MLVERLQLDRFRNLSRVEIHPDAGLNFFLGSNGQGKTSILEAIGVLGSLRSFRDARPADWIQQGQLHSELHASIIPSQQHSSWRCELSVTLTRQSEEGSVRKVVQINQKTIRSSAHYLKLKFGNAEMGLHSISFNPNDHDLVRGEPSERRTYLDRVLAAENSEYFDKLLKYHSVLDQRNRLLKDGGRRFYSLLPEFTEPLIELGSDLTLARLQWVTQHTEQVAEIARKIAPCQSRIGLIYTLKWLEKNQGFYSENSDLSVVHFAGHTPLPSLQELNAWMRAQFARVSQDEQRLGSTLVGPHRDDWSVEFNGKSLRGRGSQGEVRTALLALKLTEIESFRQATGHRPILLLDDFSSELDLERRQYLMSFLESTDLQVFISSTDSVGLPGRKFLAEGGSVAPFPKT
jgi:DNA replication and repair protein RecF